MSHDSHQDVVLKQAPFFGRTIIWSLMGTSVFAITWMAFAQTEEVVQAKGKIEPLGQVKTLQMPVGGVATQVLVKEGDTVKAGQVLIRMDARLSQDRRRSALTGLAAKRRELALKQEELARTLDVNSTIQSNLRASLALNQKVMGRLETLEKQGAAAELQLLQQRNKVQETRAQLEQAAADRLRQQAQLDQQIQQLQGQIGELGSRLAEEQVTIQYQDLKAPVAGVVFALKPTGPGFVAQASDPVLKIVPFDRLVARVQVPSDKVGFVRVGQNADISIDSFPATDFGVLKGTVNRIGSDAVPPDPAQGIADYRFPVDVRLTRQFLELKSGQRLPLQVGMSLSANIKLRKVSYLQLLLGSLEDKTSSLKRI